MKDHSKAEVVDAIENDIRNLETYETLRKWEMLDRNILEVDTSTSSKYSIILVRVDYDFVI